MEALIALDDCFLSPREIVALGSPALPTSERRLLDHIDRHNWRWDQRRSRARAGRGGGTEYHYSLLPAEAQARFLAQRGLRKFEADRDAQKSLLWQRFERSPDALKDKARERLDIVSRVRQLEAGGMEAGIAVAHVSREAKVAPSTLYNWLRLTRGLHRSDWWPALLPRHVGRTTTAECDPRAWDFLRADYLRFEQPSFTACYRRLADAAREHGWSPVPAEKTLRRRLEREVPRTAEAFARGGIPALQKIYPHQIRDRSVFAPLEAVNADGHRLDLFVRFEDGTIGRPMLVAVQDLYSGMIVGHRIGRQEDWPLVRAAFGDMIESFGIPQSVYLDNGRAFASKMMTGGAKTRFRFRVKVDEPLGLLSALKIEIHWTTPYHGQAKPIERAFRDLAEELARHPACAGAYTGNRPDAKPENYGSKAIAISVLRELAAEEIARHNNRPGRSSATAKGRSFAQTYRDALSTAVIERASREQRRLFLLAAEGVTCRKPTGEVHLAENRYWSKELAQLAGRKVIVRFDPDDLLLPISVYSLAGDHLCDAPVIAATGFNDLEAARNHARLRREWIKLQRERLEIERRLTIEDVARLLPAPEPIAVPPARIVRMTGRAAAATAIAPLAEEQAAISFGRAVRAIADSENVLPFPGAGE